MRLVVYAVRRTGQRERDMRRCGLRYVLSERRDGVRRSVRVSRERCRKLRRLRPRVPVGSELLGRHLRNGLPVGDEPVRRQLRGAGWHVHVER